MSIVSDALTTALDRFRHHALVIVGFAIVLVCLNVLVRLVSAVSPASVPAQLALYTVVFLFTVYLSFIAIRFSYRALDTPMFDMRADPMGMLKLIFAQVLLSIVSLPYIVLPLFAMLSFVDPAQLPASFTSAIELASRIPLAFTVLFSLISFYLSVRLSMMSFRVVVRGDDPIRALFASWSMTRGSFWPLCAYLLIPLAVLLVLASMLALVSVVFLSLGVLGAIMLALVSIALFVFFTLVIDPVLAIGKAKLFETLDIA